MSDTSHSNDSFLTGLVLGALLGAGVYYFLTSTEEGKKVKKQLAIRSEDLLDNFGDLVTEFEQKGEEFKKQAERVEKVLEDKQINQIERLQERGRQAVKYFTKNGKPLS